MASNYIKVRDGKQSAEFFWDITGPKTFNAAHRRALSKMFEMRRQGGAPVLSVYEHPTYRGRALLPIAIPCVGGCERCAPALPGGNPDESDD